MPACTHRLAGSERNFRLAVTMAENAGPTAPILLRGDLDRAVSDAAELGYDALEMHVPDIWKFDAESVRHTVAGKNLSVSALVSGQLFVRKGLSLSNDDPAVVEKAVEGLSLFIDAASILSCGVVIGWVRGQVGDDRKGKLSRQADALRRCALHAKELGVPLLIEVINRYELDSLNSTAETIAFIRDNDLPSTYVHLDTFHMNIDEYSPEKAIRMCGDLLGYMHLAENTRWYPGHDRLDFDSVFNALHDIGYSGCISVECLPYPSGYEAAKRAYEFLTYRYLYQGDFKSLSK